MGGMPTAASRRPRPRVLVVPAASPVPPQATRQPRVLAAPAASPVPPEVTRPTWGARVIPRATVLTDAQRLPPARRLRAADSDVPDESRIVFRDGTVALL